IVSIYPPQGQLPGYPPEYRSTRGVLTTSSDRYLVYLPPVRPADSIRSLGYDRCPACTIATADPNRYMLVRAPCEKIRRAQPARQLPKWASYVEHRWTNRCR